MNQLAVQQNYSVIGNPEKKQLLKDTFFKGATDEEFMLFAHACERSGLDPFMKQIYPVKRWDSKLGREAMAIQTGIDGYRLIAERTGCYSPGREATYTYDKDGNIISATAYVKKMTKDGTWHEVCATAFWDEYCQKNKDGKPLAFWAKMPHGQLAKCAEALALRKAFPAECSGIYTKEEMEQAEIPTAIEKPLEIINETQVYELQEIFEECDPTYVKQIMTALEKSPQKITDLSQLPLTLYERVKNAAITRSKQKYLTSAVSNV